GDLFHMTFAQLSEGSSSPTFGGCDQLLLAARSKIANCCGIALRRKKCTHHCDGPPLSHRSCQIAGSLKFSPFPSTRGRTPDNSPASSPPPRNLLETSLRRDLPAARLVSPKRWFCSPHQRAPSTPRPPPPSCAHLA